MSNYNQSNNAKNNYHNSQRKNTGHSGNPKPPFNKRPSVYNFTPISDKVIYPEWSDKVSHDIPFKDGISCSLTLDIIAETPILIGGERSNSTTMSNTIHFYKQPDGKFAIPGSSIRGAIRSIVEIISFSRMQMIDDKWLSWRDLQNKQYTNQMSNNSKAGWLKFDGEKWFFCVTDFESVPFSDLGSGMTWTKKSTAIERSASYIQAGNALLDGDGYIVFTGNTGATGNAAKKKEFWFVQPEHDWLVVNEEVIKGFLQIHEKKSDDKKDDKKDNELENLKKMVQQGHYPAIPVFALLDNKGQPTAIGLASMFRLVYKKSIGQLRPESHKQITDKLDFSEIVFGKVDENKGETSLKSRVHFLPSVISSNHEPMNGIDVVLNSPKPSFYPYYLKQTQGDKLGTVKFTQDNNKPKPIYKTYDHGELSGYKRYPVRNKAIPLLATTEQKKIGSTLMPLPKNSKFTGKITVHNLKPIELGAIVWAISWGNQDHLRHSLGMGKSYGYGQVKISITNMDDLVSKNDGNTITLKECLSLFEAYMSEQVDNWKLSSSITNLLAQANPSLASQLSNIFPLEQPKLSGANGNEFVAIKKDGGYLPSYVQLTKK